VTLAADRRRNGPAPPRPLLRPFDRRLPAQARAARGLLALTACLGVAATILIIAQAGLLARALATAAPGTAAALRGTLAALALVIAGRAAVAWAGEAAALRAAATVRSQLRRKLLARAADLGPAWLSREGPGELTALATHGLDSLDGYFARYLPQVLLAVLVPAAVIARIAVADWVSAVIIGVTLPLVPVFAVLVGLHTKARTQRQWQLLARLGGHFLDVVEGLPTLKLFGQGRRQAGLIARVTGEHRQATMVTLRQAFLSALVLDLAATLATALVAVEVGLRLLGGHLGYQQAMLILLLTPEVYLPLRAVGTFYHASMAGAVAGGRALEILGGQPRPAAGNARRPGRADLGRDVIELAAVAVAYPGREAPALAGLSLRLAPGDKVMVSGPSGAGKSTLLAVLLRYAEPARGELLAAGSPVRDLDARRWREQIAWVPQHPTLFAGSIRDNIALGRPDAGPDLIEAAAELAGASEFIAGLPSGYRTRIGERGLCLSAGQRQRIALARAFLRQSPVLLLDEPTAHLDGESAAALRARAGGALRPVTVVVVSHDESWSAWADRRIRLTAPAASEVLPAGAGRRAGTAALTPPAVAEA
jgi:ATP-binding cassette, subfamily C, bacterial CydD